MEYNSGEFTCKICNLPKMNDYTNWLSRKKFINNSINTQWIFYYKTILNKKELTCRYYSKSCFVKPFFICDDNKCLPFGFCEGKVVASFFIWPFIIVVACAKDNNLIILTTKYCNFCKKYLKCDTTIVKGVLLFLLSIILFPFMIIYVIMFGLLYILVFMWIDVCGYLCCKKNVYKYTYLYILNNNIIQGS